MADVLGTFEQAVLLAIFRLGEEAYGRGILKAVEARLDREIAAGAVHATLARLEEKDMISSRVAEGTPVRAGRARRYYAVRPAGVRALNASKAAIDSIWQGFAWPLKGRA